MTQAVEVEVGSQVAFSSGEYSDYRVGIFARVLKPINAEVWGAMQESATQVPSWGGDPRFDETKAVAWLIANGYIEELSYTELHLGDYGKCPSWANA